MISAAYNVARMGSVTAPGNTVMMTNGQWVATRHTPDAVACRNGTFAPGTSQLVLDAGTAKMRGTIISTSDGPACSSPTPISSGTVYIFMDKA